MAFHCDLGNGQSLYLENENDRTLITLAREAPGQQQRSSSGFVTGPWRSPPEIHRVGGEVRIKIDTAEREYIFTVLGNAITLMPEAKTPGVETLTLEPAPDTPKMEPMRMGNMSMNFTPMTMTMGNMSMSMGDKYCTQCGAKVSPKAKFCSECGQKLN